MAQVFGCPLNFSPMRNGIRMFSNANVVNFQNYKSKGNQAKKEIFKAKFKQKGSDNKRKEHKKENLVEWILLKRTKDTVRS